MCTKPVLATEMLERAPDAGVTASWVVADAVYGGSGWCSKRGRSPTCWPSPANCLCGPASVTIA